MLYPSRVQYIDALKKYETSVLAPILQGGKPVRSGWDLATSSGGFALVCPVTVGADKYGLRCFLSEQVEIKARYNTVEQYLSGRNLPYFVPYGYVEQGIRVDGRVYPIGYIKWVEGQTLDAFVADHYHDRELTEKTANAFFEMVTTLHRHTISHGDLQHDNIIVVERNRAISLVLIDYDSVTVPGVLSELPTRGVPEYQHPFRIKGTKCSRIAEIDYFSELVIYLSLKAIAEKPTLHDQKKTDALLFDRPDFNSPHTSAIFQALDALSSETSRLANELRTYCKATTLDRFQPLENIISPSATAVLEGYFTIAPKQPSSQAETAGPAQASSTGGKTAGIQDIWGQVFPNSQPPAPASATPAPPGATTPKQPITAPTPAVAVSPVPWTDLFALVAVIVTAIVLMATTTVKTTSLTAQSGWYDTGRQIEANSHVCILAFGSWTVSEGNLGKVGPAGYSSDLDARISNSTGAKVCKVNQNAPYGALIGTIAGKQFAVSGAVTCFRQPVDGTLSLRINDRSPCQTDNAGEMSVAIITSSLVRQIAESEIWDNN